MTDKRRWLFDEDLDGISYLRINQDYAWQAIGGRETIWRDSFGGEHRKDKPNVFFLRYYRALNSKQQASGYFLHVDGRGFGDDERSSYIGGRALGKLIGDFKYWAEAAWLFGRSGARRSKGLGFDIGATKTLATLPKRPYLTLALAYGSGDDGQGSDSSFRQSGLHSNKGRFGGVSSFRYYGYVFDPELSNLLILTAGIGVRPERDWSIDLIYHHYRQARVADKLRDDGIRADPDGIHRNLGSELDLVFGLRNWRNQALSIEAVVGIFYPGAAFGSSSSSSRHIELLLKWKF